MGHIWPIVQSTKLFSLCKWTVQRTSENHMPVHCSTLQTHGNRVSPPGTDADGSSVVNCKTYVRNNVYCMTKGVHNVAGLIAECVTNTSPSAHFCTMPVGYTCINLIIISVMNHMCNWKRSTPLRPSTTIRPSLPGRKSLCRLHRTT